MTISGEKPAARPALAVGSQVELSGANGMDNTHVVHSAVGAKSPGTAVEGKELAEEAGAVKSAAVLGFEKAGALAAKQRTADKAGAVQGATDLGVEKTGALAAKEAVIKGLTVSGGEKTGALAANQRTADTEDVIEGGADVGVDKVGALAGNQRAADNSGVVKGEADPCVEKAGALLENQRAADLVDPETGAVAGNLCAADLVVDKSAARQKNKRLPDVDVLNAVSAKKSKTASLDLGLERAVLPLVQKSDLDHDMLKRTGSVTEAMDLARRENKICVIYISGPDETSRRLEHSVLVDEHVAEVISRCCVFVKLKEGSADAMNFSDIYQMKSIPSVSIFELNGSMLWSHYGYISPRDLKERIDKAWGALNLQNKTEREEESTYEKEQMVLNLHHPGHDCPVKHKNQELGLTAIKDDHVLTTKLEDLGTALSGSRRSRTLYMGNIPFTVEHDQLKNFFREIGPIADVRIATHPEGKSKGFAHIEFCTIEAAEKALALNGKEILGRPVRLDMASDYSVQRSKGLGRVAVRGFPKAIPEEEIRSMLQALFYECDIQKIYIPLHKSLTNGVAYVDFSDNLSYSQALKLNGSEAGGFKMFISGIRGSGAQSGKEFGD